MKTFVARFQLGKQGITKNFIESLALAFKNRKQIRVSVLKSCCRDRQELQKLGEDLQKKLPIKCNLRIIGFTIILIKQ